MCYKTYAVQQFWHVIHFSAVILEIVTVTEKMYKKKKKKCAFDFSPHSNSQHFLFLYTCAHLHANCISDV